MEEIGLFDGSFMHHQSVTMGEDNSHIAPRYIKFFRNEYKEINFFTDMCLAEVAKAPESAINFAWLVEPPSLSITHYQYVLKNYDQFSYVLSFAKGMLAGRVPNFIYYPLGGLWIAMDKIGIYNKTKLLSLMVSEKVVATGHVMRHAIRAFAKEYGIAVYGRGINPVQSKLQALADYAFSIVVECCQEEGHFSEKLIDCFATGTIPIYWGSDISSFFDMKGVIVFDNLRDLFTILPKLEMKDYSDRMSSVHENFQRCQNYFCAEDYIYEKYIKEQT